MKGKLKDVSDERQSEVENPLARLGVILALLDHDLLRVQQAIRRGGLDELLGPVASDLLRIRKDICQVQVFIREIWERGQKERWNA